MADEDLTISFQGSLIQRAIQDFEDSRKVDALMSCKAGTFPTSYAHLPFSQYLCLPAISELFPNPVHLIHIPFRDQPIAEEMEAAVNHFVLFLTQQTGVAYSYELSCIGRAPEFNYVVRQKPPFSNLEYEVANDHPMHMFPEGTFSRDALITGVTIKSHYFESPPPPQVPDLLKRYVGYLNVLPSSEVDPALS